jgi:hypothetical protein
MRLSIISACAFAAGVLALAACANQNGVVPPSQSPVAPTSTQDAAPQSEAPVSSVPDGSKASDSADTADASSVSPDVTTCAKSPPQYWWIFSGACDTFVLKPSGGTFSLGAYSSISIKGSIGKNTLKTSAKVSLADATGKNGDIAKYKGQSFPVYRARGTTVVYAAANNQSTHAIKPIVQQGKPVLQYIITDSKGFPGKTCQAALLGEKNGKFQWSQFPGTYKVKVKTVTITVYSAPNGFALPPRGTPDYFAINCY